jgi:S1-C subfamily serine protease
VLPAVVNIRVTGERDSPVVVKDPTPERLAEALKRVERSPFASEGSGVIIDGANGHILTNSHVVDRATDLRVGLSDGRWFQGRILGQDAGSDIAVVKIDAADLPAAPLGNSDRLRVGDYVVAIGNPFGLEGSASMGIVSALRRSNLGYGIFEDFIQTDAAINPGNSGGALVDFTGRLIGINTVVAQRGNGNVGIGFAIPINMASAIARQIIDRGHVQYSGLGLDVQTLNPELVRRLKLPITQGVLISRVIPASAADIAGIAAGDVIVAVDGQRVIQRQDYMARVEIRAAGTPVELQLISAEARVTKRLLTEDIKRVAPQTLIDPKLPGLGGARLSPILLGSPVFGKLQGVTVAEALPATPAARAGLEAGDVITALNDQKVLMPEDVGRILDSVSGEFTIGLVRTGRVTKLQVR